LVPEETEVLDGKCQPAKLSVTRHDIEYEVASLLGRGLTTTCAGGFFFIPYLLQLQAHELASALGPAKREGVPNERLALGIVFESLFGYTAGIRAVDSVSRADFGLLAGLPFLPSVSTQYRFLQSITVQKGIEFQVALGRRLVALGQVVPGAAVNIDGHNIRTYSRKEMKLSFITKEDRYGKAIRTFYTQDQASKKPLLAWATYSGTTVSQITRRLADQTRMVLGREFLLVADKEWYCGKLIQELNRRYGITMLIPVRCSQGRLAEFTAIPLDQYTETIWGKIAAVYTTMKDVEGPLCMLLKKCDDGRYFALISSKQEMTAATAMPTYTKRWRIETFFGENAFLGVDHLPSLNLNAIQAMLSLRLLAYQAVDNFRNDLGRTYSSRTPELIHREFIDGVQGRVQLRGDVIEVNIYGFAHEAAVAPLLTNLDAKLQGARVDPRIPWLGSRRLRFRFH
jgi:hypothetical protein